MNRGERAEVGERNTAATVLAVTTPPQLPDLDARAALVIVDAQKAFDDSSYWGPRDNLSCEANIEALLTCWRDTGRPVVFVRHESAKPASLFHADNPGSAFKDIVTGTPDLLVRKSVNSSFHGTPDLHAWLEANDITDLVICGITTNHCCETTARVGGNLGYNVHFVLDATHTFDRTGPNGENVPAAILSHMTGVNLHGEFATVVATAQILAAASQFAVTVNGQSSTREASH